MIPSAPIELWVGIPLQGIQSAYSKLYWQDILILKFNFGCRFNLFLLINSYLHPISYFFSSSVERFRPSLKSTSQRNILNKSTKTKELSLLLFTYNWREIRWIHAFPKPQLEFEFCSPIPFIILISIMLPTLADLLICHPFYW